VASSFCSPTFLSTHQLNGKVSRISPLLSDRSQYLSPSPRKVSRRPARLCCGSSPEVFFFFFFGLWVCFLLCIFFFTLRGDPFTFWNPSRRSPVTLQRLDNFFPLFLFPNLYFYLESLLLRPRFPPPTISSIKWDPSHFSETIKFFYPEDPTFLSIFP